jgi:hypothetical protein
VKTAAPGAGPLLEARDRERFPWFLFLCVALSFIAHVGSFLIFQVVYPQRVTVPPPPPQVQLLAPATPHHEAIMSWVEAEDPALVASAHSVRPATLLEVAYHPSYAVQRTAPLGVPEPAEVMQIPAARDPLAIIRSAETRPSVPAAAPGPLPSRLTLSPSLAAQTLIQPPDLAVGVRTLMPIEPSRYLLGVSDRGAVRYIFLRESCGHRELDDAGARSLTRAAFDPIAAPITWGFASIAWGDEVIEGSGKSDGGNRKSP